MSEWNAVCMDSIWQKLWKMQQDLMKKRTKLYKKTKDVQWQIEIKSTRTNMDWMKKKNRKAKLYLESQIDKQLKCAHRCCLHGSFCCSFLLFFSFSRSGMSACSVVQCACYVYIRKLIAIFLWPMASLFFFHSCLCSSH